MSKIEKHPEAEEIEQHERPSVYYHPSHGLIAQTPDGEWEYLKEVGLADVRLPWPQGSAAVKSKNNS